MKQHVLLVLVMLLGVQAYGQKKKGKEDAPALRLDSLTHANQKLTAQLDSMSLLYDKQTIRLDSVNKDLAGHELMYTAVKEKVMRHDFDPRQTAVLIDSLKTSREKSLSGLAKETKTMSDTLARVRQENTKLKATLSGWENRAANNEQVVRDLEQLKNLLDQKIITQSEFDQRKSRLLAKWR